MSSAPLGIPKGTRDFNPGTMIRRHFIFQTIQSVFRKYGFQPLETPSMENLSVLTGKYGEEGDQLLYKLLDSGDYLKKTSTEDYQAGFQKMLPKIASKGLRYDLTVPFARFVVMNRHQIVFPFKRYQMQPVWRADRPQKGRYREFYQCDADVIGTRSLVCEAEIIAMINEVFATLGIVDYAIQLNHREVLAGIAQAIGATGKQHELAVSLDKLQKIGAEKVESDLLSKGFDTEQLNKLRPLLGLKGTWSDIKGQLTSLLEGSNAGQVGITDLDKTFSQVKAMGIEESHVEVDPCLARGLAYYTGGDF